MIDFCDSHFINIWEKYAKIVGAEFISALISGQIRNYKEGCKTVVLCDIMGVDGNNVPPRLDLCAGGA